MNELMQNLVKLQALEFEAVKDKNAEAAMKALRGRIPAQILAHYDRLVARGKKASPRSATRFAPAATCFSRSPCRNAHAAGTTYSSATLADVTSIWMSRRKQPFRSRLPCGEAQTRKSAQAQNPKTECVTLSFMRVLARCGKGIVSHGCLCPRIPAETALSVFGCGILGSLLCLRRDRLANFVAFGGASVASLCGLLAAVLALAGGAARGAVAFELGPAVIPSVSLAVKLDALSAFFLLVVSVVGLALSIYSLGYARGFYGGKVSACWARFTTRCCWRRRWSSPRTMHSSF